MKSFMTKKPAVEMTIVGFGQAGSRIVDVFAKYQTAEGEQAYNCLALNSNDGDLKELKFIDPANRISLNLGGLGKNPEKAMKILANDEKVQSKMHNFISKKLRVQDDLVLFVAGLGGGTGTSTIVKAIEDFHEIHNKPKIKAVIEAMIKKFGIDVYKENESEFNKRAFKIAEEQFVKLGVIACLPLRQDGPDALRQVNNFATKIWDLANDVKKSVSFVMFPDNQFFYDGYKGLPIVLKQHFDNYRDYANHEIASTLHEINTAATQGGTSVVMDAQDLKRVLTEQKGCLIVSKQELASSVVETSNDISKLFEKTLSTSNMHENVSLLTEGGVAKVHHVGLLAALDSTKDYGNGGFIENAVESLHERLQVTGTVFSGYVNEKNEHAVTTYAFYKADVLPMRLVKGLVEEYNEFMDRNKNVTFASANIEAIEVNETDKIIDFTLDDLGLGDLVPKVQKEEKTEPKNILDALNDFDFTL